MVVVSIDYKQQTDTIPIIFSGPKSRFGSIAHLLNIYRNSGIYITFENLRNTKSCTLAENLNSRLTPFFVDASFCPHIDPSARKKLKKRKHPLFITNPNIFVYLLKRLHEGRQRKLSSPFFSSSWSKISL